MSEFRNEINLRVRQACDSLHEAQADNDDYLIDLRVGELRALQDLATSNGVQISLPEGVLI